LPSPASQVKRLRSFLEDEQARYVQNADRVAVGPRAIELAYTLGAAARRHVERHDIDLVGQVFLHRRGNRAHIGIEAAADLVRNDEGDVALREAGRDRRGGRQGARRDSESRERVHDQSTCSTKHDALT
jgi:hypothetical protein